MNVDVVDDYNFFSIRCTQEIFVIKMMMADDGQNGEKNGRLFFKKKNFCHPILPGMMMMMMNHLKWQRNII